MPTSHTPDFLRSAFQALNLRRLDASKSADRSKYVSIYSSSDMLALDPVGTLFQTIAWLGGESASLLSGYRGTGKSTELLRLRDRLETEQNAVVLYCDMMDYINLDAPPDVPDLLLSTAGAFADQVSLLADFESSNEGYWSRMVGFLRRANLDLTEVELTGDTGIVGANLKLALRSSPSFQQRVQERLATQVGPLAQEVRDFYSSCVAKIRASRPGVPIVVLFDSLEHIRGVGQNVSTVAEHLMAVFNRTDYLRIPDVHVVYTVPPWLKVRAPDVVASYDCSLVMPCVKVTEPPYVASRETGSSRSILSQRDPTLYTPGLDALIEVVSHRFDWQNLMTREQLTQFCAASGGHFRDLFRLLQACLRVVDRMQASTLSDEMQQQAIAEIRASYLPLTLEDARWLAQMDITGDVNLKGLDQLGELARLFDTHLVLTYRNGSEWYRAHPLIAGEARRLAALNPVIGP